MLRLIWRQILKHKLPVALLVLFWLIAGSFIFARRDLFFATLSAWFVRLPPPGEQDEASAWDKLRRAEERIASEGIDLRIMTRSCEAYLPRRYFGDAREYRPDWLERLQDWRIATDEGGAGQESQLAQPDQYWQDHIEATLLSLRDAINASEYGAEISPAVHKQAQRGVVIVAESIDRLARASCRPEAALLAWGDYLSWQEARAWNQMVADMNESERSEFGPGEKDQRVLRALRGDARYVKALRAYLGGGAPDPYDADACRGPAGYTLSCAAPGEAVRAYNRLLAVAPAEEAAALHLNAARALLHWRRSNKAPERDLVQESLDHLNIAALDRENEQDARFMIARVELERRGLEAAYEQLKALQLLSRRPGFQQNEFRSLAAETLRGLGRMQDADCFTEMSDALLGPRTHCRDLQL